jgi:DnaK suppressor protein
MSEDVAGPLAAGPEVQQALEHERDQLLTDLAELDTETDGQGAYDENFADSGQVAAEQGEHKVLAGRLREQLDDVERALAKLESGGYGSCEVCGEAIGADRLEAMPAARYCIAHAG